jgi:hypothetical protein
MAVFSVRLIGTNLLPVRPEMIHVTRSSYVSKGNPDVQQPYHIHIWGGKTVTIRTSGCAGELLETSKQKTQNSLVFS